MVGDLSKLRNNIGMNIGFLVLIACVSMSCQGAEAHKGKIDTALFNWSLKSARYTLNLAFKAFIRSPKMIALILSIYFYKDILWLSKSGIEYLMGEFPEISFAACLCALWYASLYFGQEDQ